MILVLGFSFRVPSFTSSSAGLPGRMKEKQWIFSRWWNIIVNCLFKHSTTRYDDLLLLPQPNSPLSLSPSSFCLSGSTPVKVLIDCLRSMTVSSSDSELMEYSWPPHLMITDTDMAHTGSSHKHSHWDVAAVWNALEEVVFPATKKRHLNHKRNRQDN